MQPSLMPASMFFLFTELWWYGTPCNIHKDEKILKYDYNHGFKEKKSITFATKMHLWNSSREIIGKTGARFEPATHNLLAYPSTEIHAESCQKKYK